MAICCVSQVFMPWSVKAFKVVGFAPQAAWPKKREACSGVRPTGVGVGVGLGAGDGLELPPPPQAASKADGAAAMNAKFDELGLGVSADWWAAATVSVVSSGMVWLACPCEILWFHAWEASGMIAHYLEKL
jgi:hypothetical protein